MPDIAPGNIQHCKGSNTRAIATFVFLDREYGHCSFCNQRVRLKATSCFQAHSLVVLPQPHTTSECEVCSLLNILSYIGVSNGRANIYFLATVPRYAIKIGRTNGPASRRTRHVGTASPFRTRLVGRLQVARSKAAEIERWLHTRFAADRLNGEWFKTSRQLLAFVHHLSGQGERVSRNGSLSPEQLLLPNIRRSHAWQGRPLKITARLDDDTLV